MPLPRLGDGERHEVPRARVIVSDPSGDEQVVEDEGLDEFAFEMLVQHFPGAHGGQPGHVAIGGRRRPGRRAESLPAELRHPGGSGAVQPLPRLSVFPREGRDVFQGALQVFVNDQGTPIAQREGRLDLRMHEADVHLLQVQLLVEREEVERVEDVVPRVVPEPRDGRLLAGEPAP